MSNILKTAIILCAGSSTRFGTDKLFVKYLGKELITHTVNKFAGLAEQIIIVASKDNIARLQELFGDYEFAIGGKTRQESTKIGLSLCKGEIVAIHDGDRPFVSQELINLCFEQAKQYGSAVPALAPTDTTYFNGVPQERDKYLLTQTPQVFNKEAICKAYEKVSCDFTDDASVYYQSYGLVNFIMGERTNIKVTYASDLPPSSIGYGYDIHRLGQNRKLILGGITIPYSLGLIGHSDADVALHAVIDSLLSAASLKDIGQYFPNTDDKYKDISSSILLAKTLEIFTQNGYGLLSLALAIVCEKPKLASYVDQIKQNIARLTNLELNQIGVSVTTAEGIGEIGENQAIACRATCLAYKLIK
ncbi:MAG: 2-C-methyl-D-erythritol 2,4-cyclodiphosphate synthase [Clostridia bacterium]